MQHPDNDTNARDPAMNTDFSQQVAWNEQGLAPAIAVDASSGQVLMMAWMNAESLALSVREKRAIYWSRSRGKLWRKGEESGNVQKLHSIRLDCDRDTLLLEVEQVGGIACHTGRKHCFYHTLNAQGEWEIAEPVAKDPKTLYGKPHE